MQLSFKYLQFIIEALDYRIENPELQIASINKLQVYASGGKIVSPYFGAVASSLSIAA